MRNKMQLNEKADSESIADRFQVGEPFTVAAIAAVIGQQRRRAKGCGRRAAHFELRRQKTHLQAHTTSKCHH